MPHLVYRKIALRISGDELFFPFLLSALGKLLWLVLTLITLIVAFDNLRRCIENQIILAYLILSTVSFAVSLSTDLAIVRYSLAGTLVEIHKRKPLVYLLIWKATFGLIELLFAIVGIVGLCLSRRIPCNATLERTRINQAIIAIIIVAQSFEFGGNAFWVGICITSTNIEREVRDLDNETWSQAVGRWEGRLRKVANVLSNNEEATGMMREVARVFSNFFHSQGFVDIVPSDILAGFVLVRVEQADRRRVAYERYKEELQHADEKKESEEEKKASVGINPDTEEEEDDEKEEHKEGRRYICMLPYGQLRQIAQVFEEMEETRDVELLREVAAVSLYATMTYSRAIILREDTFTTHFLRLCTFDKGIKYSLCCWCGARQHGEGINFCACDNTSLPTQREQLPGTILVYADQINDTLHKPASLYVNLDRKKVIFSIRGTLSVEDAVTDALTDPASLTEAGAGWGFVGENRWAHYGILQVTCQLRRTLQETRLLEKTFAKHPGFELIITGHSLGAGIAVILTLLLRRDFPSVRCIGYGVPGALVDTVTAAECREFVTSVVVGNDIVPRMSFRSICTLRDQIMDAIARAKVNKSEILKTVFSEAHPSESLLYPADQIPDSSYKQSIDRFKSQKQPTLDELQKRDLCLPGRIIHFVKIRSQKRIGTNKSQYAMTFAETEDFREIAVSTTMISDHLPSQYYKELFKLVRKTMKRREKIRK